MATKKISDLSLRSNFDTTCSLPVDDSTQTWKVTGQQLKDAISAVTTLGDVSYAGASGVPTRLAGNTTATPKVLAQTGTGSVSAAPVWRSLLPPEIQRFTATGTTTGYLFTISTSSTCAVGDTYTNNGNTYTVLGALSAQTGAVLWCSQASAPQSSGNLTRATGSGTSTIAFTSSIACGTYTPTGTPLYIKVRGAGGGAGGQGGGTTSGRGNGAAGLPTYVGPNIVIAPGGGIGSGGTGNPGGVGGAAPTLSGATGTTLKGSDGGGIMDNLSVGMYVLGAYGGGSALFGGGGAGGTVAGAGIQGTANTGGGGGGGGVNSTSSAIAGGGGGGGGSFDVILTGTLAASYPYVIGTGGVGGAAGAAGGAGGGAGGIGGLEFTAYYQ